MKNVLSRSRLIRTRRILHRFFGGAGPVVLIVGLCLTLAAVLAVSNYLEEHRLGIAREVTEDTHQNLATRLAALSRKLDWFLGGLRASDPLPASDELLARIESFPARLPGRRDFALIKTGADGEIEALTATSRRFAEELKQTDALFGSLRRDAWTFEPVVDGKTDGMAMLARKSAGREGGQFVAVARIAVAALLNGPDSPLDPRLVRVQTPAGTLFQHPDQPVADRRVIEVPVSLPAYVLGRSVDLRYSVIGETALAALPLSIVTGLALVGSLISVISAYAVFRIEHRTRRLAVLSRRLRRSNAALSRRIADAEALNRKYLEADNKHREIFENAADGLFRIAPEGHFTTANPACAEILGFSDAEDMIDNTGHVIKAGFLDRPRSDQLIAALSKHGRIVSYEEQITRRDGQMIWVSLNVRAVCDESGEIAFFEGMMKDISDRKHAESLLLEAKEEAEFANRTKTEFLANMNHELRTPLNAIIGFSEIIRRQMFGPVGRNEYIEYAGDIHDSGKHLLELINDILDVSRVEVGKRELQESAIDPRDCIHAGVRLLRDKADAKNLSVETSVDPRIQRIWAEELALKQIVINLVSNSVKFTPDDGSIQVSLTLGADGAIELSVTDSGIGIREEDLPKVIEPFAQGVTGLTRQVEGTGLGLALVNALAELHGGGLTIESVFGKGTTARVLLPASRLLPQEAAVA